MKFQDFYKSGRSRYSFEVFPPKDEEGVLKLLEALRELSCFDPAFISCTYGAMGSTRELTKDLAVRIQRELKIPTAFHFTCIGADRSTVKRYVESLKREGLRLVVALRGDRPQGQAVTPKPPDGFAYADELVAYLKEIDGFSIAVAGYPEGHFEAPDFETDLWNLKRKVEAGADLVITQLFLDNRHYFHFLERARQMEIRVPIVPGIMPIVNVAQIQKITQMGRISLPADLHQELLEAGDDPDKVREIGIRHAEGQCRELLARGVPGIHFYTLNRSYSTRRILAGC